MVADIVTKTDGEYFRVKNALGKTEDIHVDEFQDEWHPGHPDDEVPPRRARSKASHIKAQKALKA